MTRRRTVGFNRPRYARSTLRCVLVCAFSYTKQAWSRQRPWSVSLALDTGLSVMSAPASMSLDLENRPETILGPSKLVAILNSLPASCWLLCIRRTVLFAAVLGMTGLYFTVAFELHKLPYWHSVSLSRRPLENSRKADSCALHDNSKYTEPKILFFF